MLRIAIAPRAMIARVATVLALALPAMAPAQPRPTLVVLTDIGGDPDDMQSMRRLMLYASDLDLQGLVASASGIRGELNRAEVRPHLIAAIVDDYAEAYPSLRLHDARYPHPEVLRARIRAGSPERGPEHVCSGRSTPGSRRIVEVVDSAAGPVHVAIWGGAHDLAQALHDVRATRTPQQVSNFVGRLRVYAIGDQDAPRRDGVEAAGEGTGEWIRRNFPTLRYLQAGRPGDPSLTALFRGMYQNDSAGGERPVVPLVRDQVATLNQRPWLQAHVLTGHGPLGARYPVVGQNQRTTRNVTGVKEGDTPSWFFVLPNGLGDPEQPEWGGWGGRFRPEGGNFYSDAEDEHWSGTTDAAARQKWTVARWREAYQNDFAARMDRAVRPFEAVNHNPVVVVDGDRGRQAIRRGVRAGERVVLDARESSDPDRDALRYRWWVYRDPSTCREDPAVAGARAPTATLRVPRGAAGCTIHLILEVTDDGEPALTSYRRVVLEVGG